MKKLIPYLALLLGLVTIFAALRAPQNPAKFDVVGFSRLPVLLNGRMKPLDTVARSSLLQLQGRQRVSTPEISEPLVDSPIEWLLDVTCRPEKADTYPTFAIDNPELLSLVGKSGDALKINYPSSAGKIMALIGFLPSTHRRFSYNDIRPSFRSLDDQAKLANQVEGALRTPFQRAVLQLYGNLILYQRLRHTFVWPESSDFLAEVMKFQDQVGAGAPAVRAKMAGQPHDEAAAAAMLEIGKRFEEMANIANILAVPPDADNPDPNGWKPVGGSLLDTFRTGRVNAAALAYAAFAHAWRTENPERFNKLLELFRSDLSKRFEPQFTKSDAEVRFNSAQPFYWGATLYGIAFLAAVFSWLLWPAELGRAGFWLVGLAWLLTTGGIIARMWLGGYPPVTNLYSSALFIGWGSAGLCMILEAIYKNAVGTVAAGVIGFGTLIIAHSLSLSGDTLEMMSAVLDSNFWLATHVVVVTLGYSATFLSGFLALIYIFRGLLTTSLDKQTADALGRMVYGIVCFATLFSFVGTILGGIWADQSWGRFWGWDPKENGALIIVIWNAIILHARWGGMIKQRGLMCLAVAGNIVTAWSWFGTNMLGVGLHSYGFTEAAFVALVTFVISQLVIIGFACLPLTKWRSFRGAVAK